VNGGEFGKRRKIGGSGPECGLHRRRRFGFAGGAGKGDRY
jgi:hypothetical protein